MSGAAGRLGDRAGRRELTIIIEYLFEQSDRTYGHRRIHAELDQLGRPAGLEHVRRLMRELGLVTASPRPSGGR